MMLGWPWWAYAPLVTGIMLALWAIAVVAREFMSGWLRGRRVSVLGVRHDRSCLVARYAHVLAETGGRGDIDGFPWCTCPGRHRGRGTQ